jgi:type III secretion protein J
MACTRTLFLVCTLWIAGCSVPVAAGLDESDANHVVVALDRAGIDSSKEVDPSVEGRFRVTVVHDDASRALAAMADEQVPRPKSRTLLEATDRGALVPSQAAEHAQLMAGLAGDVEQTLSHVEGVIVARVHLNLPLRDGLRDGPTTKATASVLLEHRGTPPLPTDAVQRLVAGAAPGLAPVDVTVVFLPRAVRAAVSRPDLVRVGPIEVARGSTLTLKVAFAILGSIVVLLCAAMLVVYTKWMTLRRNLPTRGRDDSVRI